MVTQFACDNPKKESCVLELQYVGYALDIYIKTGHLFIVFTHSV